MGSKAVEIGGFGVDFVSGIETDGIRIVAECDDVSVRDVT